jgi:lysophospholipase L1-like esterase/catechol 2,3-dioxygenase-like lactoylglutathione lyase family enzyme
LLFLSLCFFYSVNLVVAESPKSIQPETLKEKWALKWWEPRHQEKLKRIQQGNVDLLMIGDSITHSWENHGKKVWEKFYAHRNAVGLGFSGDRTENVIWRLQNGEVEGITPKLAVLMIGTNNTGHRMDPPQDIALGIEHIIAELQSRLPETKILLLGIFPRGATANHEMRVNNDLTNARIKNFADGERIFYLNINHKFLDAKGNLSKDVMPDLLHPRAKGYQIWAEAMEPMVAELMGENTFSKPTIDFGVVVSDLEASLEFYTKVIGFQQDSSFVVKSDVANAAGLTQIEGEVTIHKLKLGHGEGATRVKLMQIHDVKQKKVAGPYIHSQLGMSYMTIFVKDTAAAVQHAKSLGHQPLAQGPVDLGGGKMFLTLFKDPDGNFVELVGPKK